jgi:hypothetical protein
VGGIAVNNHRLLLLSAGAAVLAAYALWSGAAGNLLTLAGGGRAVAVAELPAAPAAGNGEPAEAVPLNPLSGIGIDSFDEIVGRPLFNPTRTPPPAAVEDITPVEVTETAQAAPQESAQAKDFTLLAIAIADDSKIAMVRWNKTNEVFHLKQGQYLSDWELRAVGEKEVTIGRNEETFSLRLFERARPAAPLPAQGDEEEAPIDPGGQVMEPEDTSEPDPALNSN